MPVIAFANAKGGSGKTTSALIIGCELAESSKVVIIDADPNRPISRWAQKGAPPANLRVVSSEGQGTILDEIDEARAAAPFVLVDLEGSASVLATYAMQASDMVIVPSNEQQQDADMALATLKQVSSASRGAGRHIPAVILLSRTKAAVKSRTNRFVSRQLRETVNVPVFDRELVERDAFAALFSIGGSLRNLPTKEVNGIERAIENAHAVTAEIVELLREMRQRQKVESVA